MAMLVRLKFLDEMTTDMPLCTSEGKVEFIHIPGILKSGGIQSMSPMHLIVTLGILLEKSCL